MKRHRNIIVEYANELKEERLYQIALTLIPGVGPVNAKTLISYCGGAEGVFREKRKNLLKIPGIGPAIAKSVKKNNALSLAEKELSFIDKRSLDIIYFLEADYPSRLLHVEDSPIVLYKKGNAKLNHARTVAIVGTRSPSEYGLAKCEKLVEGLKPYGVQIISGLAYGIDSTAHQSSVKHQIETIGIPGHGLDRIYPTQNRKLVAKMIEHGGILSQFTSGTKPDRENFPMRNKVIAAMADVIVVVESKRKGGSIITAEMANDYNKDVFAIPGRTTDEKSEGCNKLVKQHKANLLESAADISYIMRWEELDQSKTVQTALFVDLDPGETTVINAIREEVQIAIDMLAYRTSLPGSQLAAILLSLEFKGMIKALPGKKYVLR